MVPVARGVGGGRYADGAIVDYFANGCITRFANGTHMAQIAPAGSFGVWAEPETGGEGYMADGRWPMAEAKRARSEAGRSEIATRFGGNYTPRQAVAAGRRR